jgi:HJR/Mrr/RecB family endonuclease
MCRHWLFVVLCWFALFMTLFRAEIHPAIAGVAASVVVVMVIAALPHLFTPHLFTPTTPTPKAKKLTLQLDDVRLMDGRQFEFFVASLFRSLGYRATILGGAGDQGVDIVLKSGNETIAVQCKNYAKPVGNKPVQEVYAGARYHGCSTAWVVAPEGFTKSAVVLARSVGVSLYDAQSLQAWIRQIDRRE